MATVFDPEMFLTQTQTESPLKMPISPMTFAITGQDKFDRLQILYDDMLKKIEAAQAAMARYESEKDQTYFLRGLPNVNFPVFYPKQE
jgi:hypothetical protein